MTLRKISPPPMTHIHSGSASSAIDSADRLEVTQLDVDGLSPAPGDVRAPHIDPALFVLADADGDADEHTSRTGIRYRFLRYDRLPA